MSPPSLVSYTLSLHDALPISLAAFEQRRAGAAWPRRHSGWLRLRRLGSPRLSAGPPSPPRTGAGGDRKSTRLNSSHLGISYAVFCLKKKNVFTNSTCIDGRIT